MSTPSSPTSSSSKTAMFGRHNGPVAVLDLKSNQVRPLDWSDVKDKGYPTLKMPRIKNIVPIYLPRPGTNEEEYIATVHLWSLGIAYNLQRLLRSSSELYVVNSKVQVSEKAA